VTVGGVEGGVKNCFRDLQGLSARLSAKEASVVAGSPLKLLPLLPKSLNFALSLAKWTTSEFSCLSCQIRARKSFGVGRVSDT
jgi:hypothetical protein